MDNLAANEVQLKTERNLGDDTPATDLELELLRIPFFENLKKQTGNVSISRIAAVMRKVRLRVGYEVFDIEKGHKKFVYIQNGRLTLYGYPTTNKSTLDYDPQALQSSKAFMTLEDGGYCGHAEIINGYRLTKVMVEQECHLIVIPLVTAYSTLKTILYFSDLQQKLTFLQKVNLFEQMDSASIQKIIFSSQFCTYRRNSKVYEEGKPTSHIYIVMTGTFQITKKLESDDIFDQGLNISCIGEYQTLGIEDMLMESKEHSETVHCRSGRGVLLKVSHDTLSNYFFNRKQIMRFCRSRQNWRKDRTKQLEKTLSAHPMSAKKKRVMSSSTVGTRFQQAESMQHFQSTDIQRCLSRRSYISSKKTQFFKRHEDYLNHKYSQMNRISSAHKRYSGVFELPLKEQPKRTEIYRSRNMSELVFTKFLKKKHQIQNKIVMDYIRTKPPELIINQNVEYALFRPLNVEESPAVKKQKRTVKLIKAKYFKNPCKLNI